MAELMEETLRRFQAATKKDKPWNPETEEDEQYLSDAIVVFCYEAINRVQMMRDNKHELTSLDLASEALALRLMNPPFDQKEWKIVLPYPFLKNRPTIKS